VLDGIFLLFRVYTVIGTHIPYRSVYKLQHDKQIHRNIFVNTKLFVSCKMSCNVDKSIQQVRWQHRTYVS